MPEGSHLQDQSHCILFHISCRSIHRIWKVSTDTRVVSLMVVNGLRMAVPAARADCVVCRSLRQHGPQAGRRWARQVLSLAHLPLLSRHHHPIRMPEPVTLPSKFRVISGGQSGADIAALDWAITRRVDHGGWCPSGRRSEEGPIAAHYLLSETPLSNYLQRTEWNVRDSDATVIFTLTDALDGGSKRTAQFADKLHRPWLHFRPSVHPKFLAQFLVRHKVGTLNVAGKRESSAPGIYRFVLDTLDRALAVGPSAANGG